MSAFISENTQFTDDSGAPIVNGKIYIGSFGDAPETNLITIYANRELTIVLANPQLTDGTGRSINKIWIPGRYSVLVKNSNGVQKYIDLNAGQTPETGISTLTNVQFSDDIIAEGSTTITDLVDKEIYVFKALFDNASAVTLKIDSIAAKDVVKYGTTPLISSDIIANENIFVEYNSFVDHFNLISTLPLLSQGNVGDILTSSGLDASWQELVGVEVGTILQWPTDIVPEGYLECDGSSITTATFNDLFNIIGDIYGTIAAGVSFNLPDYRGEFFRGWDHGSGVDPDAANRIDRGDGQDGDFVGTKQNDELESHTHTRGGLQNFSTGGGTNGVSQTGADLTGPTGGNETRPRNIYIMYIIKF